MTDSGMTDVVYCHLCYNEWFKGEWGTICPHCENEATEVVRLIFLLKVASCGAVEG